MKVYLEEHLKKYPLMDIQDIIKLHLQAILGPAHLLPTKDKIKENFVKEYNEIKDLDYPYDLFLLPLYRNTQACLPHLSSPNSLYSPLLWPTAF